MNNDLITKFSLSSPVLDCSFSGNSSGSNSGSFSSGSSTAFAGGLDGKLYQLDINEGSTKLFDVNHDDAIKSIVYCRQTGLLFTGSWDKTIHILDEKSRCMVQKPISLPGKVYSMDTCQNILAIGMSDRFIWIYDTRHMNVPLQRRESSLKYQTRTVKCFPDGEGFICASIEGRVAVEFIDISESVQEEKYAFKCHRQPSQDQENTELVYPVNSVSFHPTFGTFATGGSDGVVNIWDKVNRKRVKQFSPLHSGISALDFNRDGQLLAMAASYGYEDGEKDHHPDSIFVRAVEDVEVKPKISVK